MICASCTEKIGSSETCPRCGGPSALAGRFRLLEMVGHGAVGTTYRAERIEDGAQVAVKELLIRKIEKAKAFELFEREASVLAQLSHPGIPAFHESFSSEAMRSVALYLVQEFIEGETLAELHARQRPTEEEVFGHVAELLDTLAYLSLLRPPVVHRDIKPANIMRRARGGGLVLIDFGSVRAAVDTAEGGSTVAGTFGYMAPEQLMGRALPATDIYGLGATAVALLTGRDPSELVDSDRRLNPDGLALRDDLAAVLRWMLAPEPEDRPQDATALAAHLRALLRGQTSTLALPGSRALARVPEPPRELPAKFTKSHAAGANFKLLFGALFGGIGGGSGLTATAMGMATGLWWLVLMGVVFILVFGGVGFPLMEVGRRALKRSKAIYQRGRSCSGRLTDIGQSTYRVNQQRALIYKYSYRVDGREHDGEHHTWSRLALKVGDEIAVLYLPEQPARSLLFLS